MDVDIMAEFAAWANRNHMPVPEDDEDDDYYTLWERFLDEEYNEQRKHPERYPI